MNSKSAIRHVIIIKTVSIISHSSPKKQTQRIYKSLVTHTTDCPVGKTEFQASTSMYTVS